MYCPQQPAPLSKGDVPHYGVFDNHSINNNSKLPSNLYWNFLRLYIYLAISFPLDHANDKKVLGEINQKIFYPDIEDLKGTAHYKDTDNALS